MLPTVREITGRHPALIEANSCGWLINLAALSGRFGDADTVYPGHGDPGPAAQQISEQRDYLKHYRELVRATEATATMPPECD